MRSTFFNRVSKVIFVLPALVIFTLIVFYSIIQAFIKSFYEWDGINVGNFIFIENYIKLFQDSSFYLSIKNGLIFAVVLIIYQIGLGLIFALVLSSRSIRHGKIFRKAYFIPVVISVTVVSQLWVSIFHGQFGLLNNFFEIIGLSYRQDWLSDEHYAIYVLSFACAWQFLGIVFILFYASVKSIPEHYIEAAIIDGANKVKTIFHIIIPLLSEAFKFSMISCVSGGINAFTQSFIMTSGGPGRATYTLSYMMYNAAFREQNFGYGCAIAIALIVEGLLAMYIINRFMARERITY